MVVDGEEMLQMDSDLMLQTHSSYTSLDNDDVSSSFVHRFTVLVDESDEYHDRD